VRDEIIGAAALRIEYRCSPYHQHSALYPVIAHLERALVWRQDDTPEDKLRKLEEALRPYQFPLAEVVPLFAALLSVPLCFTSYILFFYVLNSRYRSPLIPALYLFSCLGLSLAWAQARSRAAPMLSGTPPARETTTPAG